MGGIILFSYSASRMLEGNCWDSMIIPISHRQQRSVIMLIALSPVISWLAELPINETDRAMSWMSSTLFTVLPIWLFVPPVSLPLLFCELRTHVLLQQKRSKNVKKGSVRKHMAIVTEIRILPPSAWSLQGNGGRSKSWLGRSGSTSKSGSPSKPHSAVLLLQIIIA